eukprot:GFUD01002553.1.p1 GENE.GFUD01002553.1~~GFUD01002553.1.p1  ORF type:complete len:448 (+),score=77.44 GFUD01002553.1:123-1466(+)
MLKNVPLLLWLSLVARSHARFIEGDILVNDDEDLTGNPDILGGAILADPSRLWPGGIVYYRFDRTFQDRINMDKVRQMMTYIETTVQDSEGQSCIIFEENQSKIDFVLITADGGGISSGTKCFSQLGRAGGKQILNLDLSCLNNFTIVHELVHSLGFTHEHNRPDRDKYVTVHSENILRSRQNDFKKRERGNSKWFEAGDVDTQNTPFDFQSVLLYPPSVTSSKSISVNGKPILEYNSPLIPSWPSFAPDEKPLTVIDTVEISLAYNCPLDQPTLVQYIHYNRLSNAQEMNAIRLSNADKMKAIKTKMTKLENKFHDSNRGDVLDVISTQTGSRKNAETDGGAKIKICDTISCCETDDLNNHLDDRERGQEDKYDSAETLGSCYAKRIVGIPQITVTLYGNDQENGWFVDWVKIQTLDVTVYKCNINGWLDNGNGAMGPGSRTVNCV